VVDVTPEGLTLREVAPEWTAGEVQQLTGAKLVIPEGLPGDVPEMRFR
jgi:acyl CoA:acetate/3-ketoacid CoA transferase beta subunit